MESPEQRAEEARLDELWRQHQVAKWQRMEKEQMQQTLSRYQQPLQSNPQQLLQQREYQQSQYYQQQYPQEYQQYQIESSSALQQVDGRQILLNERQKSINTLQQQLQIKIDDPLVLQQLLEEVQRLQSPIPIELGQKIKQIKDQIQQLREQSQTQLKGLSFAQQRQLEQLQYEQEQYMELEEQVYPKLKQQAEQGKIQRELLAKIQWQLQQQRQRLAQEQAQKQQQEKLKPQQQTQQQPQELRKKAVYQGQPYKLQQVVQHQEPRQNKQPMKQPLQFDLVQLPMKTMAYYTALTEFYKEYKNQIDQNENGELIVSFSIKSCDPLPIKTFGGVRWFTTSAISGNRGEHGINFEIVNPSITNVLAVRGKTSNGKAEFYFGYDANNPKFNNGKKKVFQGILLYLVNKQPLYSTENRSVWAFPDVAYLSSRLTNRFEKYLFTQHDGSQIAIDQNFYRELAGAPFECYWTETENKLKGIQYKNNKK